MVKGLVCCWFTFTEDLVPLGGLFDWMWLFTEATAELSEFLRGRSYLFEITITELSGGVSGKDQAVLPKGLETGLPESTAELWNYATH